MVSVCVLCTCLCVCCTLKKKKTQRITYNLVHLGRGSYLSSRGNSGFTRENISRKIHAVKEGKNRRQRKAARIAGRPILSYQKKNKRRFMYLLHKTQ